MSTRGPTLAVIPARGGSRGLPGKLLRSLGGVPVIVHTIRAAIQATSIDHVVVSSDDPDIRRVCEEHGAAAPFRRPPELSTDEAPTAPVIRHAVEWFEQSNGPVDIVVTLQPTSPLRTASEIDEAMALLDDEADSVVSVAPIGEPISVIGTVVDGRWVGLAPRGTAARRQASPPAMRLTGGIYVTRRELVDDGVLVGRRVAALRVGLDSGIDIDTADDLRAARAAWRRRVRR
jgi:CMP-N-acetylneuraminic acid synthetase